jgi:hypothetical protein
MNIDCQQLSSVFIGTARDIVPSLLALATLGGATEEMGSFLFFVVSPKVAKASK